MSTFELPPALLPSVWPIMFTKLHSTFKFTFRCNFSQWIAGRLLDQVPALLLFGLLKHLIKELLHNVPYHTAKHELQTSFDKGLINKKVSYNE